MTASTSVRTDAAVMLDSALARAPNLAVDGKPDVADLAAAYGSGISQNHPVVHGNKLAAFLSAGLFLALDSHRLAATQAEATVAILALAAGELEEAEFAA